MDLFARDTAPSAASTRIVDVLVPVALDRNYSYRVPRGMELAAGDVVCVPLGPREVVAVVWAENANPDPRLHNRLKDVGEKLDVPPLKQELRSLVDWVANYTLSPRGMVLRMTLRMGEHLGPERVRLGVRLVGEPPKRLTPARRRLIDALSDGLLHGKSDVAKEAGVSVGVIDGLVDEGTLATEAMPRAATPPAPDPSFSMPDFSRQQRTAVDAMRALAANGSFHVALLDGVTGSGKTEVYFEAIAEVIRRGRQSLILMPEIALTGQFLDRFARRFGVRPMEWHSELTPRTRQRNWAAIAAGEAPVVVGARSALFLPYANLGLIVVDEEHDQAYKQDEGAHYHARDMAVVRGHIAKIPVVLASATPSVETEVNARKGRYQRIVLPSRFGGQHMPHIEAIDLRREPPARGRFISPRLAGEIKIAIERREQALLFLNRRGYAPLTLCRACGHRFACTICDAWLVDHRFRQRLVCHHCGFSMPRPSICPHCQAEQSLVAVGPGVERLQEEATALFPEARTMVLSSDLITSIETMRSELNEIAEGRVDIIIGTQLVAKGHNFPRLNLVGVVDADLGLSNGDPRAAERTWQLLNQVIGRAGRDQGRGIGYLQTFQPEHPVMKALIACDREAFYGSEIEQRERALYPPFGRLASLIISAGDRPTAEGFARKLAAIAPIDPRIQVLGPAEAPLAVIKGRYRFRLLIKSARAVDLSEYLRQWLAAGPKTKGNLKLEVDVDPQSFCKGPIMASLRNRLIPPLTAFLTSRKRRDAARKIHALRRRLSGAPPAVRYFHQVDDPYSQLAAQMLEPLLARYKIALEVYLVPPPDDAAAPERERLRAYGLRDAVRVARAYGLDFPSDARLPSPETAKLATRLLAADLTPAAFAERVSKIGVLWTGGNLDPGGAVSSEAAEATLEHGRGLREALGHYLGGMFQFEGEWYWGIDRLNHLEQRLTEMGLDRAARGTPPLAPYKTMRLDRQAAAGPAPVIEFWFSFRSPYVSIAFPRLRKLARHYGAELRLRPILPMIMRGLPVPSSKSRYIMLDTMREAERSGMAYGRMIEPVGAPTERCMAVQWRAMAVGKGEEFGELALKSIFAEGRSPGEDKVLFDIALRAGLTNEDVRAGLADKGWRAAAEANRVALLEAGLWGAPTYRVNGKPAHWGQDRLWALEEDIP